jgi:hypothetical protein
LALVVQQNDGIFISQKKYAGDILKKFKMEHSKPISTPVEEKLKLTKESDGKRVDATHYKSLIGSLRYLTATRPDIVYGVGLLSRYMEEPRVSHLQGAKRILRYIKGTLTEGIFYASNSDVKLVGYTDSDWAEDLETRKSTSGYAFSFGYWSNFMVFKKTTSCRVFYGRSRIYSSNKLCYSNNMAKKNFRSNASEAK